MIIGQDAPAVMKVMTLNLAHARGRAIHQALVRRANIERNLERVAAVLRREGPHLVALQEADGFSAWSGRFDHVAYLARLAEFPFYVHGDHFRRRKHVSGTALLSRLPIVDSASLRFSRSLPTPRKGLVLGRSPLPGRPDLQVEVAAVHLDFLRPRVRRRQVRQIIERLAASGEPRIIMGDFNCQWSGRDESLRLLARELDLFPCHTAARGLATFPRLRRRLDWILVSPHFEFLEYRTLPDRLSDHRAVVAVLKVVQDGAAT